MSKGKKGGNGFFGMGAVLLLTVLLVLMLVTFSLLSLSTSGCDLDRSWVLAQRRQGYYEACSRAEKAVSELVLTGETDEVPVTWEGDEILFEISVTSDQVLTVNLRLQDGNYEIISWKTVTKQN